MTPSEIISLIGVLLVMVAALWTVYGVLAARIDVVRHDYVRRDDFLRVVERFEKKLDDHLKLLSEKR
jgi:hypothetical protein